MKRSKQRRSKNKGPFRPNPKFDENCEQEVVQDFMLKPAQPLRAKTEMQGQYISSIICNDVTFGIGPAGTGKTYVAAALAAEKLLNREIEQIFITRPAVESGESLGFLPGELDDKYAPYLEPFMDALNEKIGKSQVKAMIKGKRIVAAPLAYMRGKTFKDAFVILDEAQNTTPKQMKMFLTRIGENATVIVNGDGTQCDLVGVQSGLTDAVKRLEGLRKVGVVEFAASDIVRHGLIRDIITRYEAA